MADLPSVVLRLSDVVKTYPGVVALKGVSFEVDAGEVHALVGENGAGKSTLMAVAAGSTLPDQGRVEIGGQAMAQPSPLAAQALGLAVVYQHLSILEDLTVAENMVFAMPSARRPSMAAAAGWTSSRLAVVGVEIDPSARVNELSIADRQLLEIAKALALESKVLVLDEPTESLTPVESARLFEQIRTITEAGTAVVYISHRLPEVKRVADRITVLRDGETRGTFSAANVSEEEILNLIIGRSVDQVFPEKRAAQTEVAPLFVVKKLSGHRFRDVDIEVKPGEIVGLAGIEGNGQRELMRALAGLGGSSGEVLLGGTRISVSDPGAARRSGVVYLPGDRHAEGMLLSLGVRENVSLLCLPALARFGFVQRLLERRTVSGEIERLTIRTPGLETPASSLSGGNQQKVLFARSLLAEPTVLLADEPTRGVDAGARMELYQVLRRTADDGKAVIVLSSDSIELQGLCDRVLVFSRGQIVRSLEGDQITEENITGTAITSASAGGAAARQRDWSVRRLRRFIAGDYMPSVILAAIVLGLGIYTTASNGRFSSAYNFQSMLLLATALVFIAFGQLIVLMTGGIDLSVGPLAGLVVVVLSFFAAQGQSGGLLVLGILCALGVALLVGLVNGFLIRGARLAPVLATLSTYIAIQGVSELLRPVPAGFFRAGVVNVLKTNIGWFPLAFIVAAAVGVACEILLRRSRPGLELRAVGSDETRAHRLGARVTTTHIVAYALCALFSALGGFVLAAQVAVGDASLGTEYTLTSITAVVLGGASIFGGRGSFIGAFFGAVLIQEIVTATTFLQIGVAWQFWLPGILILGGAGLYSRARGMKAVTLGAESI